MHHDVRFALIHTLTNATKPTLCSSLDSLCKRIHRARGEATLELQDFTLHLQGDGLEGRRAVAVYTLSDTGMRERFIGWAWLDGASWRALRAALYAIKPNTEVRAEAA